jgi:signal peptidase II
MRPVFWTAVAVFLLDQATKYYVVHSLRLADIRAINVWPPYFNLRMAWNEGVNFGLFAGDSDLTRWLLVAVALIISVWVFLWIRKGSHRLLVRVAAGLLVGGALGNVLDRIIYGAVADFINMSCCGITNPFAFNVADVAIFVGAVGMILFMDREKTP